MTKCAAFILMPFFAFSQQQSSFTLNGSVVGKDTGYIYLWYPDNNNKAVTDSCQLANGRFYFRGNIDIPTEAVFSTFNFSKYTPKTYDSKNIASLFLEPLNMRLSASINDFEHAALNGSRSDSERVWLLTQEDPVRRMIDSISKPVYLEYSRFLKHTKEDPKTAEAKYRREKVREMQLYLDSLTAPYYRSFRSIDSEYIVNNPGSYFATNLLWVNIRSGNNPFSNLFEIFNKMPGYIQSSRYGQRIQDIISYDKHIELGMEALDFKAVSSTGESIHLNSYRGRKYILLDFWASWCSLCREINPLLIRMHDKYKDKLEMISIASNDKEVDWKKAIKDDHMDWTQILDNPGKKAKGDSVHMINDMYYVNSLPKLMLIDKDFKIVRIFGGGGKTDLSDDKLEGELQKYLGHE